jgi:sporulation protein YunB
MPKIHLRRKRKGFQIKPINIFVLLSILVFTGIYFILSFIGSTVTPNLFRLAEIEVRKLSNFVVNKAINEHLRNNNDLDNLFILGKDNNDKIVTIDFNSSYVSKILGSITWDIQKGLRFVEEGKLDKIGMDPDILATYNKNKLKYGILYEISSGGVLNNPILANLGPKIPVKISLLGDVISNINTKVSNYGINNAIIEVSVAIQIKEQIILPFSSEVIVVEQNALIATKIIQGNIPNYYFNSLSESSPLITVPLE